MSPFHQRCRVLLLITLLLAASFHGSQGFVPLTGSAVVQTKGRSPFVLVVNHDENRLAQPTSTTGSTTSLQMSSEGGGGGKAALTTAGLVLVAALFLGGSLLPMVSGMGAMSGTAPVANSVATREQATQQIVINDKYRLSRAAIQEKLNTVPVFYVVGDKGKMGTKIYLSYNDAMDAAGNQVVKATTLDQVEYPLVLKRGRMRMAYPPIEVQKAEDALSTDTETKYTLVASKAALEDARSMNLEVAEGDFPLFVADRLAFGDPNGGLKVPLFLEKVDCATSYTRLRGTNQNLPEEPTIRALTLNDELFSMEKGTRPGMTQLSFYATADDVLRASQMIGAD